MEVFPMELDRNQLMCLNPDCPDYGKVGVGNIGIHCRKDRRYYCTTCKERFSARQGTIFYNLKTDEQKVLLALKMLSERNSFRATARTLGTNEDTVLSWLHLAAEHAEEVSRLLVQKVNASQIQVDELWSFVGKKRWVGNSTPARAR
jgi:transposase-like protein